MVSCWQTFQDTKIGIAGELKFQPFCRHGLREFLLFIRALPNSQDEMEKPILLYEEVYNLMNNNK
jgi:hypothetical protein